MASLVNHMVGSLAKATGHPDLNEAILSWLDGDRGGSDVGLGDGSSGRRLRLRLDSGGGDIRLGDGGEYDRCRSSGSGDGDGGGDGNA